MHQLQYKVVGTTKHKLRTVARASRAAGPLNGTVTEILRPNVLSWLYQVIATYLLLYWRQVMSRYFQQFKYLEGRSRPSDQIQTILWSYFIENVDLSNLVSVVCSNSPKGYSWTPNRKMQFHLSFHERAGIFILSNLLTVFWMYRKLSWMQRCLMNALWHLETKVSRWENSLLANSLEKIFAMPWIKLIGR